MSFRLVPKSVTLNDLERRNGRYVVQGHLRSPILVPIPEWEKNAGIAIASRRNTSSNHRLRGSASTVLTATAWR